jgi:hypothetical protein
LPSSALGAAVQFQSSLSTPPAAQPNAIGASSTITVSQVSTSGNPAPAQSGESSGAAVVANTTMSLNGQGAALHIVNGGVRMPDNIASFDAGQLRPLNLNQETGPLQ